MDEKELRALAVRWRLGGITPFDLRRLAGQLLDAGETAPALVDLFALSNEAAPWEGPKLFEQALKEMGAPELPESPVGSTVARWLSESVLDGSMTPQAATREAARLYVLSGYQAEPLGTLYGLDDEYGSLNGSGFSYAGRSEEEIDEDVKRSARETVSRA
jgi:hypothetical protein